METLQKWLDARLKLEDSALGFLDACRNLRTAVVSVQPLMFYTNPTSSEDILAEVSGHLDSITTAEYQIRNSRTMIHKLLNQSKSRTPINTLPSEVLAHIFAIVVSSSPCMIHSESQFNMLEVIPQVCARWHHVAIDTPSLWGHIDIPISRALRACASVLGRARLSVNRSRGLPIQLHISNCFPRLREDILLKIFSELQPDAKFYTSLELVGELSSSWGPRFMEFYSSPNASNSVTSLVLRVNGQSDYIRIPRIPLTRLLYLNLWSELHLPLDADDLAMMLRCSPELRTLSLVNLSIQPISREEEYDDDGQRVDLSFPDIHLPSLRSLQLIGNTGEGLQALASALRPGAHELEVRLRIEEPDDPEEFSSICALLARSNIVAMTVHLFDCPSDYFMCYMSAVPQLQYLILVARSVPVSEALENTLGSTYDQSPPHTPLLESLCLIGDLHNLDAPGSKEHWENVMDVWPIRSVQLLSCRFPSNRYREGADEDDEKDLSVDSGAYNKSDGDDGFLLDLREQLLRRAETVTISHTTFSQIFKGDDHSISRFRI
ncbi:pyrolysin [Ceratobasidium sp. AG-Ba]|nr:pyrolysin [Ceratobasidium sp. AG-Ba]QRW04722.1 pyrolysin [Ceratobasidium sp. AG-Ba]